MILLANAYIIVVIGILMAKAAGFLRDIIFGAHFGTSVEADIYSQIFGVASLVFTAVGVALSTLVIKNINKTEHPSEEARMAYASYFIRRVSAAVIIATAVMYVFARPMTKILLPNIGKEGMELAVKLVCIMLPSFLFIVVAYVMSGLLQNKRVFFVTAIMSLPFNVLSITTLLLGIDDVISVSIVTTIGWFLHIVILLPSFYRKGYRFFYRGKTEKESDVRAIIETACIFISGMMFQLCFIIDKMCVSGETGMVATVTYASNLFVTFSGVFVVAMSSVVFPAISQNYEHGEMKYVRELIGYIIKIMMSVFVFYLITVVFFGENLIALIYERGNFTHDATVRVGQAFVIYSFGIFGYLAQNILNKVLYIAGRYKMTVAATIVTIVLKSAFDFLFVPRLGANAAAISTTVLLTLYAAFVAVILRDVIGSYIGGDVIKTLCGILFSALLSALCAQLLSMLLPKGILPGKLEFMPPLFAALAVYAAAMWRCGVIKDLLATPLSKNK